MKQKKSVKELYKEALTFRDKVTDLKSTAFTSRSRILVPIFKEDKMEEEYFFNYKSIGRPNYPCAEFYDIHEEDMKLEINAIENESGLHIYDKTMEEKFIQARNLYQAKKTAVRFAVERFIGEKKDTNSYPPEYINEKEIRDKTEEILDEMNCKEDIYQDYKIMRVDEKTSILVIPLEEKEEGKHVELFFYNPQKYTI